MLKQKLAIFLWMVGLFLPSYVSAGTILSSHTYAWSNNVGYINFEDVTISDSVLGGHAWSANKGWINFDNVSINSSGQFSGTATGELVGTITFDCPNYCDVETDWRQATTPVAASSGGGGGGGGGPISAQ